MDIGVPSRFSCLNIEDEENQPQIKKYNESKKKIDKKLRPALKKIDLKPEKNNGKKSTSKQTGNNSTTNKRDKKKNNEQQWEEWKQKDTEFVNGHFEEDLQNAIMLSKLDYEHNKEMHKKIMHETTEKDKIKDGKKKKKKTMTFNEFVNSTKNVNNHTSDNVTSTKLKNENSSKNDNFFERIEIEAKEQLNKEEIIQKRKKREANIDEIISIAQCQEKLEQEITKNFALELDLQKAKTEIATLQGKNEALSRIFEQGEMKNLTDVLLELEKANLEKYDLTEEISKLHVLLEQERSKVATLISDSYSNKHKDKSKK